MVNALVFTLALALPACVVRAQDTPGPPAASTFYLPDAQAQFSVNIANDSSDVYFFLSAPASAWFGVGFGERMEDSLMLIAYPDSSGSNVTISPRMGRKAGEPVATHTVAVEVLPGSGVQNGLMKLKGRCKDCRVWPNGFLDATSPQQHMMFAFGPAGARTSADADAPLKRHVRYGHFTMDLTAATGVGGIPLESRESKGVVMGGVRRDGDRTALAHALLGCLVVFVGWPVNALVAGFVRRTRFHVASSIAVVVCLGVVYGLGISVSGQYNRSTAFTHPHQILALVTLLPLTLLSSLPIPQIARLHPLIPRLHSPLSTLLLTLLLITGGLGLHLAQQSRPLVLVYTALSLLLVVCLCIVHALVARRARGVQRLRGVGSVAELGLLRKESREGSEAGSATSLKGFLEESRRDSGRAGATREGSVGTAGGGAAVVGEKKGKLFGGGTMPGPQYLLNMHPGVPVHIGSGRRI